MKKDDWMERMLALKNPLAVRVMSAGVAFLSTNSEPLARRVALCAALGCTLDELRDADIELLEAGLADEIGDGWLQ